MIARDSVSLSSVPHSPTDPIIKHTWNKEVIVLSPTVQQWEEYPALLDFAFNRDYHSVGVYLVNVPESLRQTLVPIAKPKSSFKCASYEVIPCANGFSFTSTQSAASENNKKASQETHRILI